MIEYLKELFNKPVIMQTTIDQLVMCAIVFGGLALIFTIIGGCIVLYANIQKRKETKQLKRNSENNNHKSQ